MNCPKCGAPRPDGAAECPQCGVIYARFEAAAAKKRAADAEKLRAAQAARQTPKPEPAAPETTPAEASKIVNCSACGKPVSVMADNCPHCGHPVDKMLRLSPLERKIGKVVEAAIGAMILFTMLGLMYCTHKILTPQSGGGSSASSGTITIRANTVGCRSVEDFRALADMAARRDYAAFERRLKAHVATQTCKELPTGATAYREGYNGTHGADKIRIEGESGTWWINAQ